jgi:hypothetical protein
MEAIVDNGVQLQMRRWAKQLHRTADGGVCRLQQQEEREH